MNISINFLKIERQQPLRREVLIIREIKQKKQKYKTELGETYVLCFYNK